MTLNLAVSGCLPEQEAMDQPNHQVLTSGNLNTVNINVVEPGMLVPSCEFAAIEVREL
jgi:hypothetical protein